MHQWCKDCGNNGADRLLLHFSHLLLYKSMLWFTPSPLHHFPFLPSAILYIIWLCYTWFCRSDAVHGCVITYFFHSLPKYPNPFPPPCTILLIVLPVWWYMWLCFGLFSLLHSFPFNLSSLSYLLPCYILHMAMPAWWHTWLCCAIASFLLLSSLPFHLFC